VVRAVASVGSRLGVAVKVTGVRDAAEIEAVIDDPAIAPNGGLIVLPTRTHLGHGNLAHQVKVSAHRSSYDGNRDCDRRARFGAKFWRSP
jgi:hypothetical protein